MKQVHVETCIRQIIDPGDGGKLEVARLSPIQRWWLAKLIHGLLPWILRLSIRVLHSWEIRIYVVSDYSSKSQQSCILNGLLSMSPCCVCGASDQDLEMALLNDSRSKVNWFPLCLDGTVDPRVFHTYSARTIRHYFCLFVVFHGQETFMVEY